MSLESATYAVQLNTNNPTSSDPRSGGDDHLRMIKTVLQNELSAANRDWTYTGHSVVRRSTTSFTIAASDESSTYPTGRRVKVIGSTTGTVYGMVSSSTYSATTAVNLMGLTGDLANETLEVSVGPDTNAFPGDEFLTVQHFGAQADGTDDAPAFQAALNNGGVVFVPAFDKQGVRLEYTLGSVLTYPDATAYYNPGPVGLVGIGRPKLIATHTDGPVIRMRYNRQILKDIQLDADATRQAASASSNNYGLYVAGDDIASGVGDRVHHGHIENVFIYNQPADGVVGEGELASSWFLGVEVDEVGGHGFVFDRGDFSGRTNKSRPGIVTLMNCRASDCGGHAIKMGDTDNGANIPFRFYIQNFECFRVATDAAIREGVYCIYLLGDNILIQNSAFGGDDDNECIFLAGTNIDLRNNRYINPITTTAIRVGDTGAGGPATRDIRIEGMHLSLDTTVTNFVTVEGGATRVRVRQRGATGKYTNLTSYTSDTNIQAGLSEVEDDGDRVWDGSLMTERLKSDTLDTGEVLTIDDDEAYKIQLSSAARGKITVVGNISSRKTYEGYFRVTDNVHMTTMYADSDATSGGSAALTGTTGTDGRLTVSAFTDDYVYIENRTGATGGYSVSFSSLSGTVEANGVAV